MRSIKKVISTFLRKSCWCALCSLAYLWFSFLALYFGLFSNSCSFSVFFSPLLYCLLRWRWSCHRWCIVTICNSSCIVRCSRPSRIPNNNNNQKSHGITAALFGHNGGCRSLHIGRLWIVRWIPLPWHQHCEHIGRRRSTNRRLARSCHVDISVYGWHCIVDAASVIVGGQRHHTRKCNSLLYSMYISI